MPRFDPRLDGGNELVALDDSVALGVREDRPNLLVRRPVASDLLVRVEQGADPARGQPRNGRRDLETHGRVWILFGL